MQTFTYFATLNTLHKHIFLVGMPAAGKSTLGKQLAQQLGVNFIDIDTIVENNVGKSIAKIFEESGEQYFRQMEAQALRAIKNTPPSIVATGGGLPCYHDNMQWMNTIGVTIWIDIPIEELSERIQKSNARPMFAHLSLNDIYLKLVQLYEIRKKYYSIANIIVDTHDDIPLIIAKIFKITDVNDKESKN